MPFRIPSTRLLDVDAQRICLIKPSALGDVVQTLPLLGMLRSRFPTATISWVIRRALADLLTGHPDLTEIIPFHRRGSWRESLRLLALLGHRRFDLVFDLQGLSRTGIMTFATRAPFRVGLETAREGANLACNCVLPDSNRDVPAYARYWRVADALGMADHSRKAIIPISASDEASAADRLRGLPRPILADSSRRLSGRRNAGRSRNLPRLRIASTDRSSSSDQPGNGRSLPESSTSRRRENVQR